MEEFRIVTRAHVLAWRKDLESRELRPATIRRKLSALSSLFSALCNANAIEQNPVSGVSRPKAQSIQTPALSDDQVKAYLEAPDPEKQIAPSRKLKAYRDRAILSVLAFHGLRCSEMTGLRVRDIAEQRGVKFFTVHGKGSKIRYVPIHPHSLSRIEEYLTAAGHGQDREAVLFQSVRTWGKALSQEAVFQRIVSKYAIESGVDPHEVCVHSFRVTSATNAIEHSSSIEEVREWLGHSSISTTDGYIRTRVRPEDSPTFKVRY